MLYFDVIPLDTGKRHNLSPKCVNIFYCYLLFLPVHCTAFTGLGRLPYRFIFIFLVQRHSPERRRWKIKGTFLPSHGKPKVFKKGPKSVWYCRESFGNYLGRFYLTDSLLGCRSLALSPSTVDRGTLASWPWNIAACLKMGGVCVGSQVVPYNCLIASLIWRIWDPSWHLCVVYDVWECCNVYWVTCELVQI